MGASFLLYFSYRDATQQFLWRKRHLKALKWDHKTDMLFQRRQTSCLQFKDLLTVFAIAIAVSSTLNTPLQSNFSERINKSRIWSGREATAAKLLWWGRMLSGTSWQSTWPWESHLNLFYPETGAGWLTSCWDQVMSERERILLMVSSSPNQPVGTQDT